MKKLTLYCLYEAHLFFTRLCCARYVQKKRNCHKKGAIEWNKLPQHIHAINSFHIFKHTICKHLSHNLSCQNEWNTFLYFYNIFVVLIWSSVVLIIHFKCVHDNIIVLVCNNYGAWLKCLLGCWGVSMGCDWSVCQGAEGWVWVVCVWGGCMWRWE